VTWLLSPKPALAAPENVGSSTVVDEPEAGWVTDTAGAVAGAVMSSASALASQPASADTGFEKVT
jgi:hypothetical protein